MLQNTYCTSFEATMRLAYSQRPTQTGSVQPLGDRPCVLRDNTNILGTERIQ